MEPLYFLNRNYHQMKVYLVASEICNNFPNTSYASVQNINLRVKLMSSFLAFHTKENKLFC